MLAKIGVIVRQVALIALLAAFLEMLLPEKKMTRYVRLVLGLFVVVAILSPLVEGVRPGLDLDVAAWDLRLDPVTATPVEQGRELAAANEEAALEVYRDRLAGQIRALVALIPGIRTVNVLVRVTGEQGYRGAIQQVVITVTLAETGKTGTGKEGGSGPQVRVDRIEVKPGAADENTSSLATGQPTAGSGNPPREQPDGQAGTGTLPVKPEATGPAGTGEQQTPAGGPGRANQETTEAGSPPGANGATSTVVQQVKTRIRDMVCHFYGLEPGQVEVTVLTPAGS
ncbi:stage III sporulation protein AF [Neomoorella thermoacetica]|uniref:stage III sporulation protein AF n=1 Tax=Neomoorella thermoacetica TaxID=1525 RepID=UPI0008FB46C7|nr:stage III sporulation protein AF [Moorella thermoacetica]APC08740.1 stage III sporulation protein SpoIIIAF [Moorella thermoacetica]